MFSPGRRGLDPNLKSRDAYVRPINGMDDVVVRPTTAPFQPPARPDASPGQGQAPGRDIATAAPRPKVFHFSEGTFASRDARGSGLHEKLIMDVLRKRQEAKAMSELPSLTTNNRRRSIMFSNIGGCRKEDLLPRPQSPFVHNEYRRPREQVPVSRGNSPAFVLDLHSDEGGANSENDCSQESIIRRSRTYPRLDGNPKTLDLRRHSESLARFDTACGGGGEQSPSVLRAESAKCRVRHPSWSEGKTNESSWGQKKRPETGPMKATNPFVNSTDSESEGKISDLMPKIMPNITVGSSDEARGGDPKSTAYTSWPTMYASPETDNHRASMDEPEYIESYHQFNVFKPRRPASETPRDHKKQLMESKDTWGPVARERSSRSPVRFSFWDAPNEVSHGTDRCPNCNEKLVRVPSRYIAVRQDERNFFHWILSKWQKRKDLQSFTDFKQHAYLPHYCHFVKGITLKGRGGTEDDDDDGYNTNSEPSPTDTDSQRKYQRDGIRHVNSRSSSLVELDITEPETQMTRLSGTVEGSTDIHRAEGLGPKLDQRRETALVDSANVKTTPEPIWDANRPPIRIPSPDLESIDSSRIKVDEMTNILHELTTKTTKDVARSELSSAKTRRHCPKKGKTQGGGRGRKKRGKKKKHGADGSHGNKGGEGEATEASDGKDSQFPQSNEDELTAVNLDVPDLPTLNDDGHGKQSKKSQKKTKRSLIIAPVVLNKPSSKDSTPTSTYSFYDFGDLTASEPKVDDESAAAKGEVALPPNWNDRMALSLQSSRFELPIDLRLLEALTPQDYLRKYCVVIPRRKLLYRNTFQQHRQKKGGIVGKKSLCTALTDVMINSMTGEQAEQLCDLLEVDEKTEVDLDLFSGIAALAERILYPEFVTEDTWNQTEYQKEMIECADFCGLEWKLRGVNVSHQVKRILKSI